MFESFYNEVEKRANAKKVEMVKIVPTHSPTFNTNVLLQNINDIASMNDIQLRNFVNRHFISILNNVYDVNKNNAINHISCFTDIRFLDAFIDVLYTNAFYDTDIIVKCNNICYDYLTLSNKNPEIVKRMLKIGSIINKTNTARLLGLGLRTDLVNLILICRYSSFNLDICIKRVNLLITQQPKIIMTFEMILEIFRIIYNENDIWVRIFQYFMFDVMPEYDDSGNKNTWVTEDAEEINSIINLVILEILNEQPKVKIRAALVNYSETYSMLYNNKPIRFTMQKLSDDYSNINDIVYYLKQEEHIIVP